jgi:hypothetical protein
MKHALSLLALFLVGPSLAQTPPNPPAQAVYPGCDQPPITAQHSWYFDPVNGDDAKGDGSTGKPWKTLSALFNFVSGNVNTPLLSTVENPRRTGVPPVAPGDALILKSGDYGAVTLGSANPPFVDVPQFISITADTGAKPIFKSIFIANTEHWAISNVEVQSPPSSWPALIEIIGNMNMAAGGATHDIALTNLTIDSAPASVWQTWTQPAQWDAGARIGVSTGRNGPGAASCIALTNSHLWAVLNGVVMYAPKALVQNVEVDHFNGDAIDIAASSVSILNNKLHDVISSTNGIHTDGVQGQLGRLPSGVPYVTYKDVLIDSNWIQAIADPWVKTNNLGSYLQAMVAFDGDWQNVRITNNVSITHSCYGVNWGSLHDSVVANNTAVWDGLPTPNCMPGIMINGVTHQGPPPSNTAMINNLGPYLGIDFRNGNTADKNVCTSVPSCTFFSIDVNGKALWQYKPGVYAGATMVDDGKQPGGGWGEFARVNNSTFDYDLRLAANAQGRSWGTMAGAPATAFGGAARAVNPGAYP